MASSQSGPARGHDFKLTLAFTGLCMFVRDHAQARLHVLLLNHGSGNHEHHAKLIYDKGYLSTGGNPARQLACDDLDGFELRLDGFSAELQPLNDPMVADLRLIAGVDPLDRSHIGSNRGSSVASRITIGSGKPGVIRQAAKWKCQRLGNGAFSCWGDLVKPPDKKIWPRRLTHWVPWTISQIPLTKGSWNLHLNPMDGSSGGKDVTLYPDSNDEIQLYVYNTTFEDLPPWPSTPVVPKANTPARHFEAYYQLTTGGNNMIPVLAEDAPIIGDPLPYRSACKPGRPPSLVGSGHSSTCISVLIDV